MKNLTTLMLLATLVACGGCESTDTTTATPEPVVTTPTLPLAPVKPTFKFAVGDKAILTVPPDGRTFDVTIAEITEVRDFGTGKGEETRPSQGYVVIVEQEVETDQGIMVFQIGIEVPEFALSHKK